MSEIMALLTQEVARMLPPLIPTPKQGLRGEKGVPGRTPILGVDFMVPTAEEIARNVKVRDGRDAPTMEEIITSLKEILPELIKEHAPQRNYSLIPRRSNSYFKVVQLTGTKNGVNREFYLPEAPGYNTQIFLILNGALLELDRHFTVRGVTLTYAAATAAPKSNWNHFAIIYRP